MKATFLKHVGCRRELWALSDVERLQLESAGHAVLRATTLQEVAEWCDDELLGWIKVGFDSPRGQRVFEAWLLANGDNGVIFERGAPLHLGIGVSRSVVADMKLDRVELVGMIQVALDEFEVPTLELWSRS